LNYKERINLRLTLLKKLYDDYFNNYGNEVKIIFDQHEAEKRLALRYLTDKRLLNCRLVKDDPVQEFVAKITAKGIDVVETEISLNDVTYL
jgi:hypothetical protein